MKTQTGIWIDGARAYVITFVDGKEQVTEIKSNIERRTHHHLHSSDNGAIMGEHHINSDYKFAERKKFQTHKFLEEVIETVKNVEKIFIMGPAEMKKKLAVKLKGDINMRAKLIKVFATDHLTRNQCVARVREFYKREPEEAVRS